MLALGFLNYNYTSEFGEKIYKWIIYFVCSVFFLQEISYYLLGYRFSGLVPFFPLFYEHERGIQMEDFMMAQSMNERSASVFLEPSHFAQFIIPFLAIQLFRDIHKINYVRAIFITVVLLLLKSGVGLILASFIWLYWFFVSKKVTFKFVIIFLLLPVMLVLIYSAANMEYISELLIRTDEVSLDASSNTSGFIRIFRGYFLLSDMNVMNRFVGLSTNYVLGLLITTFDSFWLFSKELYLNTFQTKLVYFGLIGTILYYNWLFGEFRKNDLCGKIILMLLMLLMLMESVNASLILMYVCLSKTRYHSKVI